MQLAKRILKQVGLTAKTRKGMTSIMIRVDFTPTALKNPTDPRTESMTRNTPERPSNTWKQTTEFFRGIKEYTVGV